MLLALAIRLIVQPYVVGGSSMAPTLEDDNLLVVVLSTVRTTVRTPERGDVVVFHPPDRSDRSDSTYIGVAQHESYVASSYTDCRASSYCDLTVPSGAVFALNDNRDASSDSRLFGTVAAHQIEWEVVLHVWTVGLSTVTGCPRDYGHCQRACYHWPDHSRCLCT